MKRYAALLAIAALPLASCGEDSASATNVASCDPGQWVRVTRTEPNGDTDSFVVKKLPPTGYSVQGGRVTVRSDGSVEAPEGSTVECLDPTH